MPKTLLLADDSVTIQKVVGISLANEDIKLVTVENGDDAIAKAAEVRPDIVLADIVMPGKNGYEVCEAVKSDPNLQGTPVLLLTGTFEAFDAERARQVGADGHITKPFEAQALVDQVNQLLARAKRPAPAETRTAAPATQATAPAAPAPTSREGGDAFDFFDGDDGESSWPTAPGDADNASFDLMADPQPGDTDETVLLDTTRQGGGQDDPDFDAAVEAAAFDAPSLRVPLQTDDEDDLDESDQLLADEPGASARPDDSGFDLESADLSMASTVPEVPVEPGSISFSDPDVVSEPPAAAETAGNTDPLLEFDPTAGVGDAETVLDPTTVQSFDVAPEDENDAALAATPGDESDAALAVTPGDESDTALDVTPGDESDTALDVTVESETVVEDANPLRVQSPADAEAAATAPTPGGAPDLSPALERQVHATLEKVAWEAFSDVSEQVVKQVVARVEAIAWEVIPQMAETLIREEIARMQGGGESDSE